MIQAVKAGMKIPAFFWLFFCQPLHAAVGMLDVLWGEQKAMFGDDAVSSNPVLAVSLASSYSVFANKPEQQANQQVNFARLFASTSVKDDFHIFSELSIDTLSLSNIPQDKKAIQWSGEQEARLAVLGIAYQDILSAKFTQQDEKDYYGLSIKPLDFVAYHYEETVFQDKQVWRSEREGDNGLPSELKILHFIDLPLYKNTVALFGSAWQLELSRHISDIDDHEWSRLSLQYDSDDFDVSYEVQELSFDSIPQPIFDDDAIKGVARSSHDIQVHNLILSSDFSHEIAWLSTDILLEGRFAIEEFGGRGSIKQSLNLDALTYVLSNQRGTQSQWLYGVGGGKMHIDGYDSVGFFSGIIGLPYYEKNPQSIESVSWLIGRIGYLWKGKQWQVRYLWHQVIPLALEERNFNDQTPIESGSSGSDDETSYSLSWPVAGSQQTITFDYWFD